jgi:hypothetical protein
MHTVKPCPIRLAAGLIAILALLSCSQTKLIQEIEAPELAFSRNAEFEYQRQQTLALSRSPSTNFNALRQSFAKSERFEPWNMTEHQAGLAMLNAQEDGELHLCSQIARAILDQNFTSLIAHYGLATCGTVDEAIDTDLYGWILRGLLASIDASGDGQSAETAYVCNGSIEMRDFIRLKGLLMFRQENIIGSFKQIELAHTMDPETKELHMLYFDLTASRLKSFSPHAP